MANCLDHRKKKTGRTTELWQVGIVHAPVAKLLEPGYLRRAPIHWLPLQRCYAFIADPFAIAHAGHFTVFVEQLDYRTKRGEIHYYHYDNQWRLHEQGVALAAPYHLSYPFVIKHEGEIYMLPEAHKSGKLTLYRAKHFPKRWEPIATLLETPAIDASIIQHQGRWWMFYALPGPEGRALRELHIAYADSLFGPWLPHTNNPVRVARDSARPGGTPFHFENALYLPVQDCSEGYGDAVNILRIDTLTPDVFKAEIVTHLSPEGVHTDYTDGLHTVSSAGELTLIDVKRITQNTGRFWIDLQRRLRRLLGQR